VVEGVRDDQEAQAFEKVQPRRDVRPGTEHRVDGRRQQPQHWNQCEQQCDLVDQDRRVRLEHQRREQGEHQPRRNRAAQHARRGLDFRVVGGQLAAAEAEPDQQRQQRELERPEQLLCVGMGGRVFVHELPLDREAGLHREQRTVGSALIAPELPDRRRVELHQPAVDVGDRRCNRSLARLDVLAHGNRAPAQLDLLVDRTGDRLLCQRQLGHHEIDPPAERGCDRRGVGRRARRLPEGAAPGELRGILGVLARRLLQVAAPGLELLAVELPVPLETLEPPDREQLQLVALEQLRLLAH